MPRNKEAKASITHKEDRKSKVKPEGKWLDASIRKSLALASSAHPGFNVQGKATELTRP
jgi:hypothetical protein